MNSIDEMLKGFKDSLERSRIEETYLNDDGLRYCNECHTPKQERTEVDGEEKTKWISCKCDREREDQRKREEEAFKREQRSWVVEEWREYGITSSRWRKCKFTDADKNEKTYKYAISFEEMKKANCGLLLYGAVGSGKTHQAAAIANYLMDEGHTVIMTTIPAMTSRMNERYGEEKETLLDKIDGVELFIIDDFGIERNTEFGNEQANQIIDARYRSNRPLIITTNLTLDEMSKETDLAKLRIYDRVKEMCMPVRITGSSRRRGVAQKMRETAEGLLNKETEETT